MLTLSFGVLPSREDFSRGFAANCNGCYRIRHGAAGGPAFVPAGDYSESELWDLVRRLATADDPGVDLSDAPIGWVADILGTLGVEWI